MNDVINFNLSVSETEEYGLSVENAEGVPFSIDTTITVVNADGKKYDGDYTITPSSEVQTMLTKNLLMTDNVTINPIPSNYGLITWNGSTLTVS